MTTSPLISLFVSYIHQDREGLEQLKRLIKTQVAHGDLEVWEGGVIRYGEEWYESLRLRMESAKAGILLASQDFLSKDVSLAPPLIRQRQSTEAGSVELTDRMLRDALWDTFKGYHRGNETYESSADVAGYPDATKSDDLLRLSLPGGQELLRMREAVSAAMGNQALSAMVWLDEIPLSHVPAVVIIPNLPEITEKREHHTRPAALLIASLISGPTDRLPIEDTEAWTAAIVRLHAPAISLDRGGSGVDPSAREHVAVEPSGVLVVGDDWSFPSFNTLKRLTMSRESKPDRSARGDYPNYFVKLPDARTRKQAMALFEGLTGAEQPYLSRADETLMIAGLDEDEVEALRSEGAAIYRDVEFALFPDQTSEEGYLECHGLTSGSTGGKTTGLTMNDVMEHIEAPEAWTRTRGNGAAIAILDTGICGDIAEISAPRRSPIDLPTNFSGKHWRDTKGHGSMCAAIAAGSRRCGGRYDGVAPESTIIAARSLLWARDIFRAYDALIGLKAEKKLNMPLVISNSWGLKSCVPDYDLPEDHPLTDIIKAAVAAGIVVVFAAGNNHHKLNCGHDPKASGPSTIWAINSLDEVLSVGTVNRENSNQNPSTPHVNSSRGPGQWANQFPKPDCVAPTYGEVLRGKHYIDESWWGTSGACPQVAGLAALLLSRNPALTPLEVGNIIRASCTPIGLDPSCVGKGVINCREAVRMVT